MLSDLHLIAQGICLRKNNKWSDCRSFNGIINLQELYHNAQETLLDWLNQLELERESWSTVALRLKNLCGIKSRLDQNIWRVPKENDQTTMVCFTHDLLFYLILTQLLDNARHYFVGYCRCHEHPSNSLLRPYLRMSNKQLQTIIAPYRADFHWLDDLLNPLPDEMEQLLQSLDELKSSMPEDSPLVALINRWLCAELQRPATRLEEQQSLRIIKQVKHCLELIHLHDQWLDHRQLVISIMHSRHDLSFTFENYQGILKYHNAQQSMNCQEELAHWKQALKERKRRRSKFYGPTFPNRSVFNHVITQLSYLAQEQPLVPDPSRLLEWTGHPHQYVHAMGNLISDGLFQLNSCNDRAPIVQYLSQFIKVRRVDNKGFTTLSTLQTYFKKARTGDL
ncbi:hypothetical protein [Carboxylicivirga sp. M1479]|uniref:hypothetical protein n=1 Tax=Carboxylicivirga sp. M1479 TaxID=2594476 RepID=UPI00117876EB|nr:hypothetical protein [Carboxylicivirga sp. M1479]TRX70566.1 hypothetical protein FNN09_11350 [Carboxylicivirga sp. M1479]